MVFFEKEQVDVALGNTLDELQFLHGETFAVGFVLPTMGKDRQADFDEIV